MQRHRWHTPQSSDRERGALFRVATQSMPRYFFNVYDGFTSPDRDGMQLVDVHEARREALQLAIVLLDDEAVRGRLGEDWRLEVTDEVGALQFRLDFIVEPPKVRSSPTNAW